MLRFAGAAPGIATYSLGRGSSSKRVRSSGREPTLGCLFVAGAAVSAQALSEVRSKALRHDGASADCEMCYVIAEEAVVLCL